MEALDSGVDAVLTQVKAPGALENELRTPFGTMPGGQFFVTPSRTCWCIDWTWPMEDTTVDW